jgi:hypothetical protein
VGEKGFFKLLDVAGTARLRLKLGTTSGRVREVLVQLEVLFEGQWHPVVRYDNAHGFPHRDRLDRAGHVSKTSIDLPDLSAFLAFAEQDLRDRWEWYRERFLRGPRGKRQR